MRVLCLGNNSVDTDVQTTKLAQEVGHKNWGLISNVNTSINDGYYHTSIYDLTKQEILTLLSKFDLLILLNQPVEQWSHPDSFYLTIKTVDDAKSIIKVQQLMGDNNISFFENLVQTNKSFCIFPFIELLVQNGAGDTTVCCRASATVTKLSKITNWSDNREYNIIRNKMLAGELIYEHCSSCYKYENAGIISARQQETVEWANRLNLKSINDLNKIKSPAYYEVRPSNICNLQCRSCIPSNSSLIEKEYITIGWHDPKVKFEYTGFDFVNFDNLKKLYVAGGEPTAIKELYDFLKNCIRQQRTDFEFLINTNASKVSEYFLQLCNQFSNLQFVVSIDGFREVNDYVRWPSKWDTVIENAKKLNMKHKVSFNIVVSIYTISRLDQLLEFLDTEFPDSLIHCTFAESTDNLIHPYNFPNFKNLLDKVERIKNFNCYKNDRLLKSFIDGLLKNNAEVDTELLKMFFNFNDALDKSRNVKLIDYIPELDKFRTMVV